MTAIPMRWRKGLLPAALVVGAALAAAPAATASGDDGCRAECKEAQKLCHRSARLARHVCHERCDEAVDRALDRAREICRERDLAPGECARVVREAVEAAARVCREGCENASDRARRACAEQRRECRRACVAELDPACVDGCREELALCRDELAACLEPCRENLRQNLRGCFRQYGGDDGGVELLRCLADARREDRSCRSACHEDAACGRDFFACLQECPRAAE